jgi:hypothetical protein
MAYSSIQKKKCKCGCNKYPSIGCNGYAYSCMPQELKEKVGNKRKLQIKNRNKRNAAALKLHKVQRELNGDSELDLWFSLKMNTCEKICENCGASLLNYNEWEWRGSQHHIIEKSKINGCPSVATNPYNHGVLGYWCCHSQWHTSWSNAVKMPFFKIAKERFELFKKDIVEVGKIPECFLN